jgi:uncharacterized protein YecT (DUF1311 family)
METTHFLIYVCFSVFLFNALSVDVCIADDLVTAQKQVSSPGGQNAEESGMGAEYGMTDAKHTLFRKENQDYALADMMLNFTWDAVKRQVSRQVFSKKLEEQRFWIEEKRNAVANSFSMHLNESNAFTLAIIARAQELADDVSVDPEPGLYLYSRRGNAKGGHLTVKDENGVLSIQGQTFAKNGNSCEMQGEGSVTGKGWASFTSPKKQLKSKSKNQLKLIRLYF